MSKAKPRTEYVELPTPENSDDLPEHFTEIIEEIVTYLEDRFEVNDDITVDSIEYHDQNFETAIIRFPHGTTASTSVITTPLKESAFTLDGILAHGSGRVDVTIRHAPDAE